MATAESHLPPDHPKVRPETTSEASDPTPKFGPLWKITIFHGKIHYFYGHFQ
jgi:hypothetical protein